MKLTTIITFTIFTIFTVTSMLFAGSALEFERDDNTRVEIPDSESLDIDGEAITIEAWVKPASNPNGDLIILNKETSYEMKIRDYRFAVALHTGGWWWLGQDEADNDVAEDDWTHVAMTFDGDDIVQYVNGEESDRHEQAGEISSVDDALFFASRPLDHRLHNFDGQIDEIRIWNITRTEDEIADHMNVMLRGDEEGLVGYWRLDEGEGQVVTDLTDNGNDGWLGADEDEDGLDPEWVESDAPIYGGELEFEQVSFELEPLLIDETVQFVLEITNVSEEEGDEYDVEYEFVFEEEWPGWFEFDNELTGVLEVGDSEDYIMYAQGAVDPGLYEYSFFFKSNSINYQYQEITVAVWITEGLGLISGEVKDFDNDEPLPGATVELFSELDFTALTDESGDFEWEDMPAADYTLRVSLDGYITHEEEFELEDEGEAEFEIWLYHGELVAGDDVIHSMEPPPEADTLALEITNDGNGSVNWSAEIIVDVEDPVEPWTLQETVPIANPVNDPRIEGVLFIDDHYYVTGSNGDELNYIYVLDRAGEYVRRFTQPDSSRTGSEDLAWDGELIWLALDDVIWGITRDGELQATLDSPHNSTNYITYDSDRELLWVATTTSALIGIDRDGNEQIELDRFGFRKSGLAYHPDDEDGYPIYVVHERDIGQMVHKVDPVNEDTMLVTFLDDIEGEALGGHVTSSYDNKSWNFVTINNIPDVDGGDEAVVYHLNAKTSWISLNPSEGAIDAGSSIDAELMFDTRFLPADTYEAQILFTHDGFIGEDDVNVSLEVIRLSEPAVPTDLTADANAPRHISLAWTDNADNEEGYKVWRKSETEDVFSMVTELAEDAVSFVDSIPEIYLEYSYKVQAFNGVGESPMSNVATETAYGYSPTEFSLLSPENESQFYFQVEEDTALFVEFSWEESEDPDPEDDLTYTMIFGLWDEEGQSITNTLNLAADSIHSSYDLLEVLDEIDPPVGTSWDFRWWVKVTSGEDTLLSSNQLGFNISIGDGVGGEQLHPVKFGLHNVYPNPFNGLINIEYGLEGNGESSVVIYDIAGRTVALLHQSASERGLLRQSWNASQLPAGVYLLKLSEGTNYQVEKILLIK